MFFANPITVIVNRRRVDRNGDWEVLFSFPITGCAISLTSKTRAYETETFERDTVRGVTTLFPPAGSDIQSTDTVMLPDGTVWHVWGMPSDISSPFTGWRPGMQVQLRFFAG